MKRLLTLTFASAMTMLVVQSADADVVILNEYNAVGSSKFLDTDAFEVSDKSDTTFGRILGNGGNWFELVVVGSPSLNTVDMRNWKLNWIEGADEGTISLSESDTWSAVIAGTILTFIETSDGGGQLTPGSTSTAISDGWINISTLEEEALGATGLVSSVTNVAGDPAGAFSVGNGNWNLTILDAADNVIHGPSGEGIGSGGVNSNEVYKLEGPAPGSTLNDWYGINASSGFYSDGTSSSFGKANVWSSGTNTQDFSAFQAVPEPGTLGILLASLTLLATRRRK